jgi:hypothetical protein
MAEPEPEAQAGATVEKKFEVLEVNLVCTWKFGGNYDSVRARPRV